MSAHMDTPEIRQPITMTARRRSRRGGVTSREIAVDGAQYRLPLRGM